MPLLICRLEVSNQSGESGSIEVANPGEQMERIYTYDNNRNLIDIHAPNVPWYNQSFTYDALNRLTDATGWYGTTGYTYDNVGNRLTRTVIGEIENYTYIGGSNKLDQIAGANPISFIYDANGNTTGIDDKTLTYNQNNRLIRVEENSLVLGEYTYNGLGQRAIKEVNGVTTIFHYDLSGKLIAESQPDGTMTAEYLYMGKIRIARVDSGTGNIYYYLNDRLGSPQIMTDDTGTIVWEATYKPFGETTVNPKSTIVNNFRFPGQYYDQETGLHYNYHRYYDPRTGRYLTPDPIGLRAGVNVFVHVENDPINLVDPLGLTWAESLGMFWDWITGTGPERRTFGPGSNQVTDLMDAPGVKKAREAFYTKNAGRILGAGDPCQEASNLEPLANYNPGFGLQGLWQAGFDPTEQFVGNYRVDILPTPDGNSIIFIVTNTTSMTSFSYGIGPSWSRSAFGPGGNMIQTYTWREPILR